MRLRFLVMPATDLRVYAVFEAMSFTITFVVDGVESVYTFAFGAVINVPTVTAPTGYTFVGWADADGNAFAIPSVMPATDLRVYAVFEAEVLQEGIVTQVLLVIGGLLIVFLMLALLIVLRCKKEMKNLEN